MGSAPGEGLGVCGQASCVPAVVAGVLHDRQVCQGWDTTVTDSCTWLRQLRGVFKQAEIGFLPWQ